MIYSERIIQPNGIKVIVHWQYDEKEHLVENLFQNKDLATGFCVNVARKLFVDKITAFVKQKAWLFNNNLDFQHSISKAEAVTKLTQLIPSLPYMNLIGVCNSIILYKKYLTVLIPGSSSKYYQHDNAVINGIIEDCEKILKNHLLNIAS